MYEIFEQLLQSYGITAYKFCKDTGISQSTISTWVPQCNVNTRVYYIVETLLNAM